MKLPVYETFYSWQGEGCHQGRPAFFIRLFGCPVHCPWCDSAGTWHPNHIPSKIDRVEVEALAERAAAANPEFVVITGGEPAIHDLGPLTQALAQKNLTAHLETSGGFEIRGTFAWITVSPKREKPPLKENVSQADELKVIVDTEDAISYWSDELKLAHANKPIWLNPEWSQRNNPKILQAITEAVKERKAQFRAGWQVHKNYRADEMDPSAMPEASLAK
ncbi:7-carboxy-7-deazaguanine synthase QueE [Rubellicoccus peritrichatus]|uniref:7-carboxy-7-deazaguanine synthase n=1 Tax=Rubellicoccus peritrichatus TaxID=3080537 RepID=A0AAQ3LDJ3_9BACT|nr:7-carboxy-7-deazaguanine synthase QueE [Puniceicoccus sp. CR14]WOO42562.1 7-carboxy-7-deazaguanine synthase QueE [Puniceicoccus sp. CR14]